MTGGDAGAPRVPIAMATYTPAAGRVRSAVGDGFSVPEHYVHAVERAGGRCVMLSAHDPEPETALDLAAGLLLLGGGDVDAARYGRRPHTSAYGYEPLRDAFELALLAAARARELPVLAICRGLQLVNVERGGTLHQHLPSLGLAVAHRSPSDELALHRVVAEPSRLERICGADIARCSSRHHQAVDRIGSGLRVTARAEDGVIEGLEPIDPAGTWWLVAVQWHPEDTAAEDPVQQRLFDALVEQARGYRAAARSWPDARNVRR